MRKFQFKGIKLGLVLQTDIFDEYSYHNVMQDSRFGSHTT